MQHHSSSPAKSLSWRAPEFLYKHKTLIWYLNICVIAFVAFYALILVHNYVGTAVVAALFWYFMTRADDAPKTIDYKIDSHGITVDKRRISYGEIQSFSVDASNHAPVIIFNLSYTLALPVTMLVKKSDLEETVAWLGRFVPQETSVSFTHWLTHKLHY